MIDGRIKDIYDLYSQGTHRPRKILLENKQLQFPMLSIRVETGGLICDFSGRMYRNFSGGKE